jgi:hypothetical protein
MRNLVQRWPSQPDLVSLWAEARMSLHPWQYYNVSTNEILHQSDSYDMDSESRNSASSRNSSVELLKWMKDEVKPVYWALHRILHASDVDARRNNSESEISQPHLLGLHLMIHLLESAPSQTMSIVAMPYAGVFLFFLVPSVS